MSAMKVSTAALAEKFAAMMHVRLAPDGRKVHYSLSDQNAHVIAGPCDTELQLEHLCERLLGISRTKDDLEQDDLARRAAVALAQSIRVRL